MMVQEVIAQEAKEAPVESKAGNENQFFARDNNVKRDEFIAQLEAKVKGLDINDFETSAKVNPVEKLVKFKNRNLAHVANRSALWFTVGIRTLDGKNDIRRIKTQKEFDNALNDLISLTVEVLKLPPKTNNRKGNKKSNKKSKSSGITDEDRIAGIEKRIANMSKKSKGISAENGELTPAVRKYLKGKGYTLSGDKIIVRQEA